MLKSQQVIQYSKEELARMEIRDFVNEGLKDIKDGNVYDIDEVFDELEARYSNAEA